MIIPGTYTVQVGLRLFTDKSKIEVLHVMTHRHHHRQCRRTTFLPPLGLSQAATGTSYCSQRVTVRKYYDCDVRLAGVD